MITKLQRSHVEEYAYLPEHIVTYVTAISQAEPFVLQDFLAYVKEDHLTFVGYPLQEAFDEKKMKGVLDEAIRRFMPKEISLIAPTIPSSITGSPHSPSDHYYKLDLSALSIPQKTRSMMKRAMGELTVNAVRAFEEDHRHLVNEFLSSHPVDEATQRIFRRIPLYMKSVPTASVFEARTREGELAAFDIAEFGAKYYAIYMFNFRSKERYIPGASDLILSRVINQAITEQKKYLNLGLGINPGVTFFKTKWGGTPFHPYTYCLYSPRHKESLEALLQKL
jgi:hypothetical protein